MKPLLFFILLLFFFSTVHGNRKVLHRHKMLNSELLMLEENENITVKDIDKIELENNK
jgi:hypothetical protein